MNQKCYVRLLIVLALFFSVRSLAQLRPEAMRQIQSLVAEKQTRTPVQRKIASQLLQGLREFRGQKMVAGVNLERARINADKNGNLKVDITAAVNDGLLTRITAAGGTIIYASVPCKTIRAQIHLSKVEIIAAWPEVQFIQPAVLATTVGAGNPNPVGTNSLLPQVPTHSTKGTGGFRRPSLAERNRRVKEALRQYLQNRDDNAPMVLNAGAVNSQGDHAHRADDARNTFGYDGQGIKIGVLSDSYNALGTAAANVASGDLPGPGNPYGDTIPVTVLADYASASDEGRAMLQIVHDLAPKAQLFFATAFVSQASFASNILALRTTYHCDIIIDDIFYYDEPVFQDGIIAQAVNTVTADGALYFSPAGNEGSVAKGTAGVWEGDFNDGGSPAFTDSGKLGTIHNFGTVATPLNGNPIIAAGNVYTLTWADPAGASSNDYDLFLVSSTGTVKAASTNLQNGTQNPFELISSMGLVSGDRLVVFKETGAQPRALNLNTVRGSLSVATPGQIHGHAAAADAFSVAATPAALPYTSSTTPGPYPGVFTTANQVESFSSDGLRRIFFTAGGMAITPGNFLFGNNGGTLRQKPDITAADGTATTLPAGAALNPFYGTSAAAPHAGAIAALLKSANPALTPAQVRTILTTTALDIESSGYDNVSGYGIIQAYQAMQAVNPAPVATLVQGAITVAEGAFSNNSGNLDPGETGNLVVQLINPSLANATGVTAVITSATAGITIIGGSAAYGTIYASGDARNTAVPFRIGIDHSVACGTVIRFSMTVSFSGGLSPRVFPFSITVGGQVNVLISSTLGATPPAGPGFTSFTGLQTGRINRFAPVSACGISKTVTLFDNTGNRAFHAYTFVNTGSCVTVTLNSTNGISLYTVAYNDSGYIPTAPHLHFAGDPASSATTQTFAFTVAPGTAITIVVSEVVPGAAAGAAYTLEVDYASCSASPSCSPVALTTASIADGATGTPYTQSFAASGGSSNYRFSLTGELPAGLSYSGNTLSGTPTQAGSFPITITATDVTGCPAGSRNFTLVIAGNVPASTASFSGTPQSVYQGATFPFPLQAIVRDAANQPLPGVKVVFTAPATGASGTFTGGRLSDTVITNSSGIATAATFTANSTTGNYLVAATVTALPPAYFSLSNSCLDTFLVTSSEDSGPGTLREAVNLACPDIMVTFAPGVRNIVLTSGELKINKAITINGPGADLLTVSGNNASRIFHINAGFAAVSISGMTLRDGKPAANITNGGGAILINNGINIGPVTISRCVIIHNDVSLAANSFGGAIDNEGGMVTIDHCALLNNIASSRGGAIQNQGFGFMTITNSTIAGNTAGVAGIGGAIRSFLPLSISNCTIFGNAAQTGGNIARGSSTISLKNTIIAGGILIGTGGTGPDINGSGFSSGDYNLIENTSSGIITGATHDLTGISPRLLPLANYGSVIPGLLPMSNSPVINVGDPALTSGTDQRGLPRLIGMQADIGAVETNYTSAYVSGTLQETSVYTSFPEALQARVTESGNAIAGDTVVFTAPASGASGTFPGASLSATVVTNAAGLATSPVFTANNTPGNYNVIASIGAAFSPVNFNLTNTLTILPVAFDAVSARAVNCSVEIQWKTLTELNSKDFTVEYSTDNVMYKALTVIAAQGNSTTEHSYRYTHMAPAKGIGYYRIRQTDKDGNAVLTKVLTVSNPCDKVLIVAYPNPVKDRLTLQLSGTARQTVRVYDVAGRLMTQMIVSGGSHDIAVQNWAKGMYTLTITQEGKTTYTVKVVKE